MTQKIVDNAGAISIDTDVTVAQTISNGRSLKWFRKGPHQWIAEVQINVVSGDVYRGINASLQSTLVGPYTLKFPVEVTGAPSTHTVTVSGAGQTGDTINVSSTSHEATIFTAGQLVQFNNNTQVFIVKSDVVTNSSGAAVVNLNYPLPTAPAASSSVVSGNNCVFSMNLIAKPRASFGPTGLVNHDGPFRFAEVV